MEGGDLVHSHFTKLKHLNEFKKNLSNGKTFRMTTAKVKDLVDPQSGGSILGSISRGLSSVGKALSSKPAIDAYRDIGVGVATNVASSALVPVWSLMVKGLLNASPVRPRANDWQRWPSSAVQISLGRKQDPLQLVISFVNPEMLFSVENP
jgi:hypothetical protein